MPSNTSCSPSTNIIEESPPPTPTGIQVSQTDPNHPRPLSGQNVTLPTSTSADGRHASDPDDGDIIMTSQRHAWWGSGLLGIPGHHGNDRAGSSQSGGSDISLHSAYSAQDLVSSDSGMSMSVDESRSQSQGSECLPSGATTTTDLEDSESDAHSHDTSGSLFSGSVGSPSPKRPRVLNGREQPPTPNSNSSQEHNFEDNERTPTNSTHPANMYGSLFPFVTLSPRSARDSASSSSVTSPLSAQDALSSSQSSGSVSLPRTPASANQDLADPDATLIGSPVSAQDLDSTHTGSPRSAQDLSSTQTSASTRSPSSARDSGSEYESVAGTPNSARRRGDHGETRRLNSGIRVSDQGHLDSQEPHSAHAPLRRTLNFSASPNRNINV